MPIIRYAIQKDAYKIRHGKKCWYYKYEYIDIDVSEEVSNFLAEDDKTEQRYKWKKDKQLQAAKIHQVFSLDESIGRESSVLFGDIVEDTVNRENKNPLIIVLENEYNKEKDYEYRCTMNPKQYEVLQYHLKGYSNTELAKKLNIDESSVRERLHNALRVTVTSYLIHSNNQLFRFVQNEVITMYGGNLPKENTFNKTLAFMFFNRLHFSRPDLHDMISFAIDEDYNEHMKRFSDFANNTPEKA